ncbi:MAG: bifunctional riboflavin kinase/FAD synthetase [Solirubrobacteraceae bacterium]
MSALESPPEVDRSPTASMPILVTSLEDVGPRPRRVAVGNFDGVHPGHAAVIGGCDTALTFAPHPLAVLAPERVPARLTDLAAKAELAGALGVRELVVLPFNRGLAQQSAESFVQDVLVGALCAVHVSVGINFRYGSGATGDARTLAESSSFTTSAAQLVEVAGDVVCSSRIRAAIARGDLPLAARLLGRPHRMPCRLEPHDSLQTLPSGRQAAHFTVSAGHACPPPGWYASRLRRADTRRPAVETTIYVSAECGDERHHGLLVVPEIGFAAPLAGRVVVEVLRGVRAAALQVDAAATCGGAHEPSRFPMRQHEACRNG